MIDKTIALRIKGHVNEYLKEQSKKQSQRINYDELIVNPFFLAIMKNQVDIDTKKKLAKFIIFDGKIKGLTGSFGTKLQEIAKEFSHEAPKEGFHVRIKKGNKKYNVLVASGPQHNTGKVDRIRRIIEESKKKYPKETPIFGICYGNRNTLNLKFSSNIRTYLKNEKIIIGKEFWEFISGNKNCRDDVLKIITDEATKLAKSEKYDTIFDALTKNSEGLEDYFTDMYDPEKTNDPEIFWKNFLRDVYI